MAATVCFNSLQKAPPHWTNKKLKTFGKLLLRELRNLQDRDGAAMRQLKEVGTLNRQCSCDVARDVTELMSNETLYS